MLLYFMGICGTAMGNAALLARALGHQVCGADVGVYPPMSTVLEEAGIRAESGWDAARLEALAPDLVIVGNIVSRGHPEMEWLLETRRLRFVSLPEFLSAHVLEGRCNIVISGTHGKTTTTTLAAGLLHAWGADPGWLVGGVPLDLPCGAHVGGKGAPFVIEGDEYDTAFFDKRSKFIHYQPRILVINNLEFDHADIFRDLYEVRRTFSHVARLVPRGGFILINGDDPNVESLLPMDWATVWRVGVGEHNDLRIVDYEESLAGVSFGLLWRGEPWSTLRWRLPGLFNARNAAMAALAAALSQSPESPLRCDPAPLAHLRGVRRRQEILCDEEGLVIIEDFGHHPTAIAETLQSLRRRYPQAHLVACFEPRSNTARTKVFQESLPRALVHADQVLFGPVHRADKLPPAQRLDLDAVCVALRSGAAGVIAKALGDNKAVLAEAVALVRERRGRQACVLCFFSNGSFDGIIAECVRQLRTPTP